MNFKTFYIHPFTHPVKMYPYWTYLSILLKEKGHIVKQLKFLNEPAVNNVEIVDNPSHIKIVELLKDKNSYLISNDSFIPHLLNYHLPNKKSFVLFGVTDPKIYGYSQNINILKSNNFLLPNQFLNLDKLKSDKNIWPEPIFILEIIEKNV